MIDVKNPEHREALRWACEWRGIFPHMAAVCDDPKQAALNALSSPEQSAALVRALLEECRVTAHEHHETDWDGECDADVVLRVEDGCLGWADYHERFEIENVPALILALLDATDQDAALAALRGAS